MRIIALFLLFVLFSTLVDASGPLHLPTTTAVRASPRRPVEKRALEVGTVCATVDVGARLLFLTYVRVSDLVKNLEAPC
jgi:hypothetical protein